MRQDYQLLYSYLQQDIERCMQLDLPEKERAEQCFWIATNHWEKLKKCITAQPFTSDGDEMEFFRTVKPQFTATIEYFVLLSEVLLCIPPGKLEAIAYWDYEMQRFTRFCERHADFITYYESGLRYHDSLYFLRRSAPVVKPSPKTPVYDDDPAFCSSHDQYVRGYLAFQRYYSYAKERITALKNQQTINLALPAGKH